MRGAALPFLHRAAAAGHQPARAHLHCLRRPAAPTTRLPAVDQTAFCLAGCPVSRGRWVGLGSSTAAMAAGAMPEDVVVQYVVLRRDLWTELGWPLGSVVAQACHAATAVVYHNRDDATVAQYCGPDNLDHMTKVRRPACKPAHQRSWRRTTSHERLSASRGMEETVRHIHS